MKNLLLIIFFAINNAFGQVSHDTTQKDLKQNCYKDYFDDKEESVFTKVESRGYYKGGPDVFLNFLNSHIDFNAIVNNLKLNERHYSDTVTVKFIIGKNGFISDLTISTARNEVFRRELLQAFKASACNWAPGENSGRLINEWFTLTIYYLIDRQLGRLSTVIGFDIPKH